LAAGISHKGVGRPIRVVVAKPGLDGHDRGAKVIARTLRDAGMEVIYTGLHQSPRLIVATVVEEDADAVAISILSGAHMTLVPEVISRLEQEQAGDVVVLAGGTISATDADKLVAGGVSSVHGPGTTREELVQAVTEAVAKRNRVIP
jgi:methylmalonyl-CoA mutase C-terminal domain/subunit